MNFFKKLSSTKSLKINAIFNSLYQILNLIVPLITAPYISRVLGPENNGIYSYYYSIVTYFVLFATFGFNEFGTKYIAEVRENKSERSKRFFAIYTSKLIIGSLTLIAYLIMIISLYLNDIPSLVLYLLFSLFVISTVFDPTFYFQGKENFVSICIRNSLIRLLTMICIFCFVRAENGLFTYTLIMSCGQLLSILIMFLSFSKGEIKFTKPNYLDIKLSFRNSLNYFLPALAVTLFYSLNQTLLGLFGYEGAESGFFSQASKIVTILQTLVGSIGIIILSRMSYLFSLNNVEEIKKKIKKIFQAFWSCALPITFGLCAIANVFVPLFLGEGYDKSIISVYIMAPVIIFSPLNTLFGNIYFRPTNQIKKQTIIIFIACILNIAICVILIPFSQSFGASIGRLVAELVQTPLLMFYSYKFISLKDVFKPALKPLINSIIMFLCVFLFLYYVDLNVYLQILISLIIGVASYFLLEILTKDTFLMELLNQGISILKRKKIKKDDINMNKLDIKILVTGVHGQLGYDVCKELKNRGYTNVVGIDVKELDITDEKAVHEYINNYKPNIIMHNAAWTAVDKAEENEEKVYAVNALGTKYLAEVAKEVGAKLMYISTDYVFDGKGENFFEIDSPKNGLSVYGKTKSKGEDFVISTLKEYWIIRISWVFGINGNNFIRTMLKLAKAGKKELNVVDDQIGSPTYTYDLAKLMCDMIETNKYGVYHATNEGICSWYEFAKYIFEKTGYADIKVNPVSTSEYKKLVPNQADRPLNSRLSKKSLDEAGFKHLPDWHDAVDRYIGELKEKGEF